jgi:atypical dual specificity phosphatase
MTLFHKIAYYPTVGYRVLLEYFGLRTRYTRIDNHCILGALPFKTDGEHLSKNENVKAVLTLNEPHELKYLKFF